MRICPDCGYQGTEARCPRDGTPLVPAPDPSAPQPVAPPIPLDDEDEDDGDEVTDVSAAGSSGSRSSSRPASWQAQEPGTGNRSDPLIGTIMEGRYEILSRIGAGGMGVVYRARQTTMDRIVAVKVLLRSLASNETNVKRFQLEARAASRLNHPNTITIHDFGQTRDGTLYIAMEFLDGESLDRVLQREKRLDPQRVVRIMTQVCRSLAEAHAAGIIHRDLKPDNIFLNRINNEPDFVKVLDFGVAKLKDPGSIGDGSGTLTQAGMIFGTPKYMSPEQAQSFELDPTSDIYSLGIIMYELLAGRPPFTGDAPLSILIKHVHEQPAPLSQLVPGGAIPPALEAVVMKALQKNRQYRQQSANELRLELEEALLTFTSAPSQVLLQVGSLAAHPAFKPPGVASSPRLDALVGMPTEPETDVPQTLPQGKFPQGRTPPRSEPVEAWDFSSEEGGALPIRPEPQPRWKRLVLALLVVLLAAGLAGALWVVRSQLAPPQPLSGSAATTGPGTASSAAAGKGPGAAAARADAGAHRAPSPDGGSPPEEPQKLAQVGVGAADAGTPEKSAEAASKPPAGRPGTPPPRKPPAPAGSAGDVKPPVRDTVELRLDANERGVSVYVNGSEFVGLTPTRIKRKKELLPITLTFRKQGWRDEQTIVTLDRDQLVKVELSPIRGTSTASLPVAGSTPQGGATASPPSSTTPPPPPPPPPKEGGSKDFGKFGDFKTLDFDR